MRSADKVIVNIFIVSHVVKTHSSVPALVRALAIPAPSMIAKSNQPQ